MNVAMILSGGKGSRFGSDVPKQYSLLFGKEVISYSVEALKNASKCDAMFVVAGVEELESLNEKYGIHCVEGGEERNESLRRGLEYIKKEYPYCQNVFITEAARPFLTWQLVDEYFGLLEEYDAVITAKHITDSLGKVGQTVTDRSEYYLIQAPEAFKFEILYQNFKADSLITATVQQLPEDTKVMYYYDFKNNLKITYPEDLQIAELMMKLRNGEE